MFSVCCFCLFVLLVVFVCVVRLVCLVCYVCVVRFVWFVSFLWFVGLFVCWLVGLFNWLEALISLAGLVVCSKVCFCLFDCLLLFLFCLFAFLFVPLPL